MNVAVLSESPADEAAIRILVDALLGSQTQLVAAPALRTRGWPAVARVLPSVFKHLYYQTDADALVVVVDSDDSPVHQKQHDIVREPACRLCELHRIVASIEGSIRSPRHRPMLKTAIGLAVPAVEAWYRCGEDPHVTEATWIQQMNSKRFSYDRKRLKRDVYGTDRPSIEQETRLAIQAATRLAGNIVLLEQAFPHGFGPLVTDVRSW